MIPTVLTVPNAWTIVSTEAGGRIHGCGPYRTRAAAKAAIADRRRNGVAFSDERAEVIRLVLRWDGWTMYATDTRGQ